MAVGKSSRCFNTMAKLRPRSHTEMRGNCLVRKVAQRHDDPEPCHCLKLSLQEWCTRVSFFGRRSVSRWRAPHRCANSAVDQFQSVINMRAYRLIRQPNAMQRPKQPITETITGKYVPVRFAPCAAGASPITNTKQCPAQAGDRAPPVRLGLKRCTLFCGNASRYATSRGHNRHCTMSASSCSMSPVDQLPFSHCGGRKVGLLTVLRYGDVNGN